MIDETTMSRHYELKNSKICQLLIINDSTKTINMINSIKINRIFNDEILQIFIMLNQMFIKFIKIIKTLTIQIEIIKIIKILITINLTTRTIKLIIKIKIVNKTQVDTQTSSFCQYRRLDYKSLLIRESTCHQTRQILMSINVVFFNLDQIRRRINLTISIVLIKLNLFIKLTSRINRLSNRSINQKMKKIIIMTKMRIEITRKNRKNHDTMSTTLIS